MRFHWPLRAVSVLALVSLTCACGGGGGGGSNPNPPNPPAPQFDWYASASTGSDGGAGSEASPFRTITFACSVATSGQTIKVLPGTYSTAIGEAFPIDVPAGVTILGDEANKGVGAIATDIVGGGTVPPPNAVAVFHAAVVPGASSTVAGFRIRNDEPDNPIFPYAVWLQAASVTLRNNQILNSKSGIICKNGVGSHVITGNLVQGHTGAGLVFLDASGVGSRVENNVFTLNGYGVEFDTIGGDLGGGAAGSTGGNVISCNTSNDLWTNVSITIDAQNNAWDHVPPTIGAGAGADLNPNMAAPTFVTTGATLAPGACP